MRNLLALIGLVVVLFVAIGYSRGWYAFNVTPGLDGKKHIAVEVDTGKIKNDTATATDKAGDLIDSFRTKSPASATATALPGVK